MKKGILACLLLAVVLIASSCSSGKSANSGESASLKKVKVMLDWFPNTNHTGIYAAKEKGYYKKEGLDVEIVEPGEGTSTDQVVAAGKADYGISYQENITQARSNGIPLVSIGAIIQENTSAFASLKKDGIASPKDFEGKRYGGWGAPTEEAVLNAVMKKNGADPGKVKNVTLGATDFFQSIGRDADFEWIYYGWDGIEAERKGIKLNYIFLKDLDPALNYYTPVIAASEKKIKEDKETTAKFMKATSLGYQFAINHPEDAADLLIKQVPDINADLVKKSQKWISSQYQGKAEVWGQQKEEVWKKYADWMFERKLIKENIDASKAYTNEFLPKDSTD
ncbi:ABC transporter substrate-binding protein [Metabacillus sp. GX 13764]|uniref:ABC transporter substrate-binding protein n=1 Tax=Metabacillus kandeliae TaxID=2900151 RepID=UPI001E5FEF4F|nr:ABC transporter substrate-binding protein [Metabacillus kandeliae]MCD7035867.1 ABC transporter substrate-binding protein [Metabacillus kandeliae]